MTRPIDTFVADRLPFDKLEDLAKRARAEAEASDGTEYALLNEFCEEVTYHMTEEQTEAWDDFSLKATAVEIIDEAMRLARSNI